MSRTLHASSTTPILLETLTTNRDRAEERRRGKNSDYEDASAVLSALGGSGGGGGAGGGGPLGPDIGQVRPWAGLWPGGRVLGEHKGGGCLCQYATILLRRMI